MMNASECVAATVGPGGVPGAEADGPMSVEEAKALWVEKKEAPQSDTESRELQHVEYPLDSEWAKVVKTNQT